MKPVDFIFPAEKAMREMSICPFCGVGIRESDFRDQLSVKEFRISGLCQRCQNEMFGE